LLQDGDRITIGKTKFYFVQISQPNSKSAEKTQASSVPEPAQKTPPQTTRPECHNCHAELEDHLKFCTSCGTKIIEKPVTPSCPDCGAQITSGLNFCLQCGKKL
jgi:predicted RNA-binding Zn-ribbon protein involved in translation (DUF1610 family)